jgi:hypothetical protein
MARKAPKTNRDIRGKKVLRKRKKKINQTNRIISSVLLGLGRFGAGGTRLFNLREKK